MIKISALILHYKRVDLTIRCLESIIANTSNDLDYEILVISSSPEQNEELSNKLQEYGDKVRLIKLPQNLGYSGFNIGAQNASGKYVAMFNNDSYIRDDVMSKAVKYLESNLEYKAVGGNIIDDQSGELYKGVYKIPRLIDEIILFSFFNRLFKIIKWSPRSYSNFLYANKNLASDDFDVESVCNAFLIINKEAFLKVGGLMQESYLYYTEHDFAQKFRSNNFKIRFLHDLRLVHAWSTTTSGSFSNSRRQTILLIDRFNYFKKHHGIISSIIVCLFTTILHPRSLIQIPGVLINLSSVLQEHNTMVNILKSYKQNN